MCRMGPAAIGDEWSRTASCVAFSIMQADMPSFGGVGLVHRLCFFWSAIICAAYHKKKSGNSTVMVPIEYTRETNKETALHVPLHNICSMYKAPEKQKEENNAQWKKMPLIEKWEALKGSSAC